MKNLLSKRSWLKWKNPLSTHRFLIRRSSQNGWRRKQKLSNRFWLRLAGLWTLIMKRKETYLIRFWFLNQNSNIFMKVTHKYSVLSCLFLFEFLLNYISKDVELLMVCFWTVQSPRDADERQRKDRRSNELKSS